LPLWGHHKTLKLISFVWATVPAANAAAGGERRKGMQIKSG